MLKKQASLPKGLKKLHQLKRSGKIKHYADTDTLEYVQRARSANWHGRQAAESMAYHKAQGETWLGLYGRQHYLEPSIIRRMRAKAKPDPFKSTAQRLQERRIKILRRDIKSKRKPTPGKVIIGYPEQSRAQRQLRDLGFKESRISKII